ncbi:MAG: SDR family oxidoreductase [Pirellulaceae bacterium]
MNQAPGRILVTGASGQLGSYVLRELRRRGWPAVAWSLRPNVELFGCRCQSVDLRQTDQMVVAFRDANPEFVIHAAAMSGVGGCFGDPAQARQVNTTATRLLAELAARHSARLVYVSTDLVFRGDLVGRGDGGLSDVGRGDKESYVETDCPAPLSVYGQTKASAERPVLDYPRHLVLRISLLFGPSINGRPAFFEQQLQALKNGSPCTLFRDEWRTPLDLQTAAEGLLDVVHADVTGILHFGGPQRMTRLEMGQRLARFLGRDESVITAVDRDDVPAAEPRPRDTSLNSQAWCQLFPHSPRLEYEQALRVMGVTG